MTTELTPRELRVSAEQIDEIRSSLFGRYIGRRATDHAFARAIIAADRALVAPQAQPAAEPAEAADIEPADIEPCSYCADWPDAKARHAKHLAYLWATSTRDTDRWQLLYEATEAAIDAATPQHPAAASAGAEVETFDLNDVVPPSAHDWLEDSRGAAPSNWMDGWDACRNRTRTLVIGLNTAMQMGRAALQSPAQPSECSHCDANGMVEEGDPETGGNKVPCSHCATPPAQPAAGEATEPSEANSVLAGMQEKFAEFEASGGLQRGIQEIRDRNRLQWLHGPGSNDVDGYEWGIYRVKWVNGKAAEVWQTNSDFSDLDAAMGAQSPAQPAAGKAGLKLMEAVNTKHELSAIETAALDRALVKSVKFIDAAGEAPPSECGLTECRGKPRCKTCTAMAAPAVAQPAVTDAMVSRFLGWPIPKGFNPDGGISFDGRKDDEWNKNKTWPTGTNLFSYEQAKAMLEHVLGAVAQPAVEVREPLTADQIDGFLLAHRMMDQWPTQAQIHGFARDIEAAVSAPLASTTPPKA